MFRIFPSTYKLLFLVMIAFLFTGCAALKPAVSPDYTEPVADIDFVLIPGGTFLMGSDTYSDEKPVRSVTVNDLFVGMFEVTFDQYDQYCKASTKCELPSDSEWGRGDRPVINVSWQEANAFADWLSEQTGQTYRLPTEAEWEYFARAGTTSPYPTGATLLDNIALCRNCGSQWDNQMTAPVGSFMPNFWGLYDTLGNVHEWVLDDYERNYEKTPNDGSAFLKSESEMKVFRGGAWNSRTTNSRPASRDGAPPNTTRNDLGFRLVLLPDGKTPLPKK